MFKVHRYHDISTGHRVAGHESKCKHLHGHNYRVHFTCTTTELDQLGRVIDFGVVKEKLCMWLEENWDHKFLHWEKDELIQTFIKALQCDFIDTCGKAYLPTPDSICNGLESFVAVPFNPTAENMARYLVEVIGPQQLEGTGVQLSHVLIEETAKCHASYGA